MAFNQNQAPLEDVLRSVGVSDGNGGYGNFSVVKTKDNGAGRYVDEWDFIINTPGRQRVIVGDSIYANRPKERHRFGPEALATY